MITIMMRDYLCYVCNLEACHPEMDDVSRSRNPLETQGLSQLLNSLTFKSDQLLISPHNINPESHIKVMRIKEMINN